VKRGDKAAENLRKSGKVGNLALQYRTSAPRFCATARVDYGIDMTMQLATLIHGIYPRTYKGMPAYWEKQIAETKRLGYVETLAGRRVECRGDWSKRSKQRWALESTSINYPVQGVGAEQKYLALACVKPILSKFESHFFMDLHDGLYFLVPDHMVSSFVPELQAILDDLPYQDAWDYTPSIPMPWEVKAGPSWGQLKEWKI
jgi:DNA polymerase-1